MLCMQQCIDLCEFSPEEADSLRERVMLADILSIQAKCPKLRDATGNGSDGATGCEMLDIRDRLLEAVWAAEDFDDLGRVLESYCDYELDEEAARRAAI
jgi:hypothetical protein